MADRPKLLLTNDDGIGAPGLEALRAAVAGRGDVRVLAPAGPQSGCGHAVTTHQPLRLLAHEDGQGSVDGTPADCVRLALAAPGARPDWLLSGVNAGANLGVDLFHSGTAAAAREAAIHGLPAIAVSHLIRKGFALDWDRATGWVRRVLDRLLLEPPGPGCFWNVNLPHLAPDDPEPDWVDCPPDPSPLPLGYRHDGDLATYAGVYYDRARRPGSDVDVCFGGRIAVSRVSLFG